MSNHKKNKSRKIKRVPSQENNLTKTTLNQNENFSPSSNKNTNSTSVENINGIVVVSQTNNTEVSNDKKSFDTELVINKFSGIITVKSKNLEDNSLASLEAPQYVYDQATAQQSQAAAEQIRQQNQQNAEKASAQPKIVKSKNNSVIAGFDTYDDLDLTKIK